MSQINIAQQSSYAPSSAESLHPTHKASEYTVGGHAKATEDKQKPLHDEHILVVRRSHLFTADAAWHGLKEVNIDHYMHIINHRKEFHPRSLMEVDFNYKQIIPYLIFQHDNNY